MFSALLGQIMGGGLGPFPAGWSYYKEASLTAKGSEAGTISVSNGSATVTGSGTAFTDWGPGDRILLPDTNWYTISAVASATSLTITENYPGPNASGESYSLRLTDYQVRLMVGESSGSSGADVHCEGKCNADFSDLRFTAADGATQFDYWIESVSGTTPNQTATVTIKGNQIETADTYLRMYYGNSGAISASDGESVFLFFDDFDGSVLDTDKWYNDVATGYGDSLTIADSQLQLSVADSGYRWESAIDSKVSFPFPCKIELRYKIVANGTGTSIAVAANFGVHPNEHTELNLEAVRYFSFHAWHGALTNDWINSVGTPPDAADNDVLNNTWIRETALFLSGASKQYRQGVLELSDTHTNSLTTVFLELEYAVNSASAVGAQYIYVDFLAASRAVVAEPEFGAWGSEQLV